MKLLDHLGKIIIALFITMVLCFGYAINTISNGIEEAGGVKSLMIDAGKELKDITTEIEAYEPEQEK